MKSLLEKEITLIDVRDIRELWKEGTIENSNIFQEGCLNSGWIQKVRITRQIKFKILKKFFFCALGWRSALATKSLIEMGFKNVAHVEGGFDALKKSGLKYN